MEEALKQSMSWLNNAIEEDKEKEERETFQAQQKAAITLDMTGENPHYTKNDLKQFETKKVWESSIVQYPTPTSRATKYAILIDASSFAYKYYFGSPKKYNPAFENENINMVELMLFKIFNHLRAKPDYFFICWEGGKWFRNEIFPAYKAHRPEKEENLKWQCRLLHNVLKSIWLPSLFFPNWEADDAINSLSKQLQEKDANLYSYIHTGDKDYYQIASDKTYIVRWKKEQVNKEFFKEKYGFGNEHFVKYLSCIGDSADNIPGIVKWLWEKRIDKLFKAWFYGLDDFLQNEEKILQEKLLTPRLFWMLKEPETRERYELNQNLISLHSFEETKPEIEKPLFERDEMKEKFTYDNVVKTIVQAMQMEQLLPIIENIFTK